MFTFFPLLWDDVLCCCYTRLRSEKKYNWKTELNTDTHNGFDFMIAFNLLAVSSSVRVRAAKWAREQLRRWSISPPALEVASGIPPTPTWHDYEPPADRAAPRQLKWRPRLRFSIYGSSLRRFDRMDRIYRIWNRARMIYFNSRWYYVAPTELWDIVVR